MRAGSTWPCVPAGIRDAAKDNRQLRDRVGQFAALQREVKRVVSMTGGVSADIFADLRCHVRGSDPTELAFKSRRIGLAVRCHPRAPHVLSHQTLRGAPPDSRWFNFSRTMRPVNADQNSVVGVRSAPAILRVTMMAQTHFAAASTGRKGAATDLTERATVVVPPGRTHLTHCKFSG